MASREAAKAAECHNGADERGKVGIDVRNADFREDSRQRREHRGHDGPELPGQCTAIHIVRVPPRYPASVPEIHPRVEEVDPRVKSAGIGA